jgi:hypothetical protein
MRKVIAGATLVVSGLVSTAASAGTVGWTPYIIRDAATATDHGSYYEFVTDVGGEKAALGTNKINGATIGDIQQLQITRLDNNSAGGSAYAPYMNFWIKDANGKYAVLANEPSNPEWTGTSEWDTTGANLMTKSAKVFEAEAGFVLPAGFVQGVSLFAAFANYIIDAPSHVVGGTGAPNDLTTGVSYGFNWVFGDTQANYVSGDNPGYQVSNPIATAAGVNPVPLPMAAWGGLALMGALGAKRLRRRNAAE